MKSCVCLGLGFALLTSALGCCSLHRCGAGADPCGAGQLAGGSKCHLKKLFKRGGGCGCGCHSQGCQCGGAGTCGAPAGCGAPGGCGAPMTSPGCGVPSSDCGCGQPMQSYEMPALQRSMMTPTSDVPAPVPGAPPAQPTVVPTVPGTDVPAPPPSASNWQPNRRPAQTVSYEEFQRMPGTVVSAPTMIAAPVQASAQPTLAASQPAQEVSAPVIIVQPSNWAPARQN